MGKLPERVGLRPSSLHVKVALTFSEFFCHVRLRAHKQCRRGLIAVAIT